MRTWPGLLTTLAMVVAFDVALILGDAPKPSAVTVTLDPMGAPRRAAPRGAPPAPGGSTVSNAAPVITCNTPAPSPTWTCQNGTWVMVPTSATTGAAAGSPSTSLDGGAGNCLGVQPGAGWSCRGGAWTPPGSASPASTATPPVPDIPSPPSQPSAPPAPAAGQTGCTGPNPAAGVPGLVARCVNGSWVIGS